jgi:hypothetical protein
MSEKFRLEWSSDRKACYVRGPFSLGLEIDHDDYEDDTDIDIEKLLKLLNEYWKPQEVTVNEGDILPFDEQCKWVRKQIKQVAQTVRAMHRHPEFTSVHSQGEEILQLAYRHLEDASMRMGKAIQAYDGGKSADSDAVSIYDESRKCI